MVVLVKEDGDDSDEWGDGSESDDDGNVVMMKW